MGRSSKTPLILFLASMIATLDVIALGALVFLLVRGGGEAPAPTPSPAPTVQTTFTPEPTATAVPSPTPSPEPTPVPVELGETEDAGQEYIDKIVFLGDSTTYWLYGYDVLPHTQVWTDSIGTMSLFNWAVDPIAYYDPASPDSFVELSIPDCAARRQPEVLVITLGINGIALLDEAEFKDYYVNLIQAIQQASPDTRIILQSVYPVNDSEVPRGISNAGVDAANGWIYDIAVQTGVRYLYSHDLLMDETGNLRDDYNNHDGMGIHLNVAGLSVVLQNIRTHAWL